MKTEKEYVTCVVCLHKYVGIIPKGGDGSTLFPRSHTRDVPISRYGYGESLGKERCPGCNLEALEYNKESW